MIFVEQLSAVTLLVDFFLGVTFGIVGGAAYGSRREDGDSSLLGVAPDAVSAGARMMYGLYRRDDDGYLASLLPGSRQVPGNDPEQRRGDGPAAQREDPKR
jgi:hypothetical protein